ncbi:hypothetical protein [Prosthecobacter sp.]|uniref:hypothetical protein n=1 Tax=Prosthecobacter sp. TaxID=1965333 RepID=UPI002ABB55C1|nr:hypothetical protein [Prosthecobacter sp.]MDZ4404114.1 hypothetical protein [Prosthecobacter sp.]
MLLLVLPWHLAAELPREWTSADGRKLQAALSKASSNGVTLILPGGQQIDLPMAKLSPGDQAYVQQWLVDDAKRESSFGLKVLGTASSLATTFLKSKAAGGMGRGFGKIIDIHISPGGQDLYSMRVDEGDGETLLEVNVQMLPPKVARGIESLEVSKLSLVYLKRDKTAGEAAVKPRWLPGAPTKLGVHKVFTLDNGKATAFGVGFLLPAGASPVGLRYDGLVKLEVPIR